MTRTSVLDAAIARFRDIPRFTRYGSWECNFTPESALRQIDRWVADLGLDAADFPRPHGGRWYFQLLPEPQRSEWTFAWLDFIFRGTATGRALRFDNPAWMAIRRLSGTEFAIVGRLRWESLGNPNLIRALLLKADDPPTLAVLKWCVEMNGEGGEKQI